MGRPDTAEHPAIAVVGMGCVFPGAHSPFELWENVLAGRREFRRIPQARLPLEDYHDFDPAAPGKTYCDQVAVITDWSFDPLDFKISPVTAEATDPTHWLALWCAREAFADAGIDCARMDRERIAVVIGNSLGGEFGRSGYLGLRVPFAERALRRALRDAPEMSGAQKRALLDRFRHYFRSPLPAFTEDSLAGTMSNTIAGRICNHYDLGGGAFTVDGACSSSLLAVAHACSALLERELDVVLCGGVDVSLDPFELVGFAKAQALARHDIAPYDAGAEGMLPGEGCGLFVLMRREDAAASGRRVRALIRGWGYASDGTAGMTAPRRKGQVRAMRRAYARSGYSLATVGLIEGHGTGTALGDRVELDGLLELIDEELGAGSGGGAGEGPAAPHCRLGSIKGNIGHCKAAAGAAGLIKAVMALERKFLPPTAGLREPHPLLRRRRGGLRAALCGQVWAASTVPRRAAVSAFGFGGANAHLTLEEDDGDAVPAVGDVRLQGSAQDCELILLSAGSEGELIDRSDHLRALAARISRSELTDLAACLAQRDEGEAWRLAIVAEAPWHLRRQLERIVEGLLAGRPLAALGDEDAGVFAGVVPAGAQPPRLVMMFPGQGTQRPGMAGHFLYRYPEVAALCSDFDAESAGGLSEWFRRDPRVADGEFVERWDSRLRATEVAQPAIVAASLLALRVLEFHGLMPDFVLGHSLGMVSALAAKGALDRVEAVRVAALRGRSMAGVELEDPGGMVAVAAGAERVGRLLLDVGGDAAVANFNSPAQTVVSGDSAAMAALMAHCARLGIGCRALPVSHAFHSERMAAAADTFRQRLEEVAFRPPEETVVSTLNGEILPVDADLAGFLSDHLRQPVRFDRAVLRISELRPDLWVEVGPGAVQCGFVRDMLGEQAAPCHTTDRAGADGFYQLDALLGRAYVLGFPVRRDRLFARRFSKPFPLEDHAPRLLVNPCERPVRRPSGGLADGAGSSAAPCSAPVPASSEGDALDRALGFAMEWLAERTGFPRDQLTPDLRLRSDLDLDSIKTSELFQALAADRRLDFGPFPGLENAAIREVVDTVFSALSRDDDLEPARALVPAYPPGDQAPGADWARAFEMASVEAPLEAEGEAPAMESAAVALVASRQTRRVGAVLEALIDKGLEARVLSPAAFLRRSGDAAAWGAVVWILPSGRSMLHETDADRFARRLQAHTALLRRMARRVLASPADRRRWLVLRPDRAPGRIQAADAGAALLKSLRYEHPGLTAKWLCVPDRWPPRRWARVVGDELASGGRRVLYRYSADGRRTTEAALLAATQASASPPLSSADVVLVTGGGRGITARLARLLARETGARLALVGRSPADSPAVATTLAELAAEGFQARYFPCDVTDREAVLRLAGRIAGRIAPVTGILHGAGISEPALFTELTGDAYRRTIRVKANGLWDLLAACPPRTLRMLHVVSSVVAYTGMARQADYALANAWVDGLVAEVRAACPELHTASLAYSLWRDTGMGRDLGTVDALRALGITALDDESGVRLYRDVLRGGSGGRLALTGRLVPLQEAQLHPAPPVARGRFLERPLRWIPGVELEAESTLSHDSDPYLRDHVVGGTPMLPAVMGIEAMVSAAVACTGRTDLAVITDLRFRRAVTVPEGAAHTIRVSARVEHRAAAGDGRPEVRVRLCSQMDGFAQDMFSGVCRFGRAAGVAASPVAAVPAGAASVGVLVPADVFVPGLLFQGPFFRCLKGLLEISPESSTIATIAVPTPRSYFGTGLPQRLSSPAPAYRDGLLQAALPLLGRAAVATRIGEMRLVAAPTPGDELVCHVRFVSRADGRTTVDIDAFDAGRAPVEQLRGVVFEPVRQRAYAVPISQPELTAQLAARWPGEPFAFAAVAHRSTGAGGAGRTRPRVSLANLRAARAAAVDYARKVRGVTLDPAEASIGHDDSGKPHLRLAGSEVADRLAGIGVSLSDTRGLSVAVAGPRHLGVDLEPIERRSGDVWRRLLGMEGYALTLRIAGETGESLSAAATRAWTLLEAGYKAVGRRPALLRCRLEPDGTWLTLSSEEPRLSFLSVRVRGRLDGSLPALALAVAAEPR